MTSKQVKTFLFSDFCGFSKVSEQAGRPERFIAFIALCLFCMLLALVTRRRKRWWEAGVFFLQKSFLSRPSERRIWELKQSAEVHSSLQLCFHKAGLGKASETLLPAKTVQIK